jgi:hypothetical protein
MGKVSGQIQMGRKYGPAIELLHFIICRMQVHINKESSVVKYRLEYFGSRLMQVHTVRSNRYVNGALCVKSRNYGYDKSR